MLFRILLRIAPLLFLFPLFINADMLVPSPSVGMIFHESYCKKSLNAIEDYVHRVKVNGYSTFYLCTDTVDVEALKNLIDSEAKKNGSSFSEISGLNLYGPVTSTKTAGWLKGSGDRVYATTTLMFTNVRLTYSDNTLIDIKAANETPYPERWVSHLFMSPDESNTDISETLYELSGRITPLGDVSTGENFRSSLQNHISSARTIPYYSFPNGEGTSIIGMTSFPFFWMITGFARIQEGYSFWNRFQTRGDIIGSPILLTLMFILEAYSINSYLSTEPYQSYDNRWKKVMLTKPLTSDGLLLLEYHNP